MTQEKLELSARYAVELTAMAHDVIATNRYFVLSGDGDLRLYRLDLQSAEVHARGGHPRWGMGTDTRLPVSL